jgi:epsilon-lactone hydrolase
MASFQHRLFVLALQLTRRKAKLANLGAFRASISQDRKKGPDRPSTDIQRRVSLHHEWRNGLEIYTLSPKSSYVGKHVLYLHGGAYVRPITGYHWRMLAELVEQSGCTITVPLYPLAPEYQCKFTINHMQEVYHLARLRAIGNPLVLMGDSAGGGMALALCFALREQGVGLPEQLVLICPWVDLGMSNPDIPATEPSDPMLSYCSLATAGAWYAGSLSTEHAWVSPLRGDLSGLPPITIYVGTRDIVHHDSLIMVETVRKQGGRVDVHVGEDLIHVWPLLPIPEGRVARAELSCLLRMP